MRVRAGLILSVVAVLLATLAGAGEALTPAGTRIKNQGTVLYRDAAGTEHQTTSNEIVIVVQPVYGLSIVPDGTAPASPGQRQQAVAGQRMYFPYVLTNTGNTDDIYLVVPVFATADSNFRPQLPGGGTGVEIFQDRDFDGVVDATEPLVAGWNDVNGDGRVDSSEVGRAPVGTLAQDERTGLIIAYDVPTSVVSDDVAYVGVSGASTHAGTLPGGSTNPAERDGDNVHQTTVGGDAVVTLTKEAAPGTATSGDSVTYTLTGENEGVHAARGRSYTAGTSTYTGVLIYDVLPTYGVTSWTVTGTPQGSHSATGAVGSVFYAGPADTSGDPTGWSWSTGYTAGDKVVGYVTSDGSTNQDLLVDETMTLEFTVRVPAGYPAGYVDNYGRSTYQDNQSPAGVQNVKSNNAPVHVTGVPGVDIRDTDYLASPPSRTPPDDGSGSSNDTQTYTNAAAGATKLFTNRVTNRGTATDTFDVTVTGASNLPTGWQVSWFRAGGAILLGDTDDDGTVDVGPLAAGAYRDIVVSVSIPADQASLATAARVVVEARSSLNSTVLDTTLDRVVQVSPAGVRIHNRDGGPDPGLTVAPGECAVYPLDVRNTGGRSDTFILSWSDLAPGWTMVFYRDGNDNGLLEGSEKTPVTATVLLASAAEDHLLAVLCAPPNAGPASDISVTFTAESTNAPGTTDQQTDTINVAVRCRIDVRPDHSGTVRPGGVVWYEHVLANVGTTAATVNLSASSTELEWTHLLYYGENYDDGRGHAYVAGEQVVDTDSDGVPDVPFLATGSSVTLRVKIFAPTEIAEGIVDVAVITAIPDCNGPSDEVVDVTQVVAGGLVLRKSDSWTDVNGNGAVDAGDRITYTTDYRNISAESLSNVMVYEAIPAYTTYVGGSAAAGSPPAGLSVQITYSGDGGQTWSGTEPAGVTNIRWSLSNDLPAGAGTFGSGSTGVSFTVRIGD